MHLCKRFRLGLRFSALVWSACMLRIAVAAGIQVISPPAGSVIAPGQTFPVVVQTDPGSGIRMVRVVGAGFGLADFQRAPAAPFVLTAPKAILGAVEIRALGITAPEQGVFSDPVNLFIETTSAIEDMKVNLDDIEFLKLGEQFPLRITGVFAGEEFDITRSSRTTYSSDNSAVAYVSAGGIVTATGPGTARVSASYPSRVLSVNVTVTANSPPANNAPPVTHAVVVPPPNAAGWHHSDVQVRLLGVPAEGGAGVKEIAYRLEGAQPAPLFTAPSPSVISVMSPGVTRAIYRAADYAGNLEAERQITVRIDKSSPELRGMPATDCTLWPPNKKMVRVAVISATDSVSGVAAGSLLVSATSNEAQSAAGPDIIINGGTVELRADRLGTGKGRTYTISASVKDIAGNTTTAKATCVVPHDAR